MEDRPLEKADLISRAALLEDLSYCAPELWQDEEYIKAKIMKQHAVDAIPVEWLREKANGNDFVTGRAARFILRAWEKEAGQ